MKLMRISMVSAVFVLIAVVMAVWLYPALPARVPTHWDIHSQVNGYTSRLWAAAMPALLIAALTILMMVSPVISPRRFEIKPFLHVFGVVNLCVQAMALVIGLCILLSAAGYAVSVPVVVMLAIGALFMVIGNYMGKLRKNFFIGIRTPWTLASDLVWERTHRLGGWLFMAAGLLAMLVTALRAPLWLPIVLILSVVAMCWLYSLVIYQRLERHRRV